MAGEVVPSRLRARAVRKSFGATRALDGADLDVAAGEVHALVGQNGAGKSTLVAVLEGAIAPDAGTIELDGTPYRPHGAIHARARGVAVVHQERRLCPHLTVAENIALGDEPVRMGFVRRGEARRLARGALDAVTGGRAAPIDPDARVMDLGPADRQLVEIARALARERCRLIVLDEPTSSLGAADAAALLALVRTLAGRGISVVYISHLLDEVRRVADAYTVLRDGRAVRTGRMADADVPSLVEAMAGRRVDRLFPRSVRAPGDVVLAIGALAGRARPVEASLELRRGEVLGVAGLVGSGRTELLRAIFGLDPVRSGRIRVGAQVGPSSPARRIEGGTGMLSEDRAGEGIALGLSVADNVVLGGPRATPWIVSAGWRRTAARVWIERLDIRGGGPDAPARSLSGGNQQKIALARLLRLDLDVLLLDEPTAGIDVASRAEVWRLVDEAALGGKAVLVVSSALEELCGACDRVAVMRRGHLGPARPATELDERTLLAEVAAG